MKTPEGLRRVQNADERLNRDLAEHVDSNVQETHGHGGDVGAMPFGAHAENLKFEDIATSSPTTPVLSPEVDNGTVFVPSQDETTRAQQGDQPHIHGGTREISSTRSKTTWTMCP